MVCLHEGSLPHGVFGCDTKGHPKSGPNGGPVSPGIGTSPDPGPGPPQCVCTGSMVVNIGLTQRGSSFTEKSCG